MCVVGNRCAVQTQKRLATKRQLARVSFLRSVESSVKQVTRVDFTHTPVDLIARGEACEEFLLFCF